MVGILIATHGKLAEGLFDSLGMLTGVGEQMDYVSLVPGEAPVDFLKKTEDKIKALDTGKGVLALVDIIGGTPNNTLYKLAQNHNIRIVTGVNLPIAITVATERTEEDTLDTLVQSVIEVGREQINEFGKK